MTDAPPPTPGTPATSPAPANPGKTMGIVALVLSIVGVHLVGIIVGFIGLNQSKKAGQKNGFAVAGIIVGFVGLIAVIALLAGFGSIFAGIFGACAELGPGVHEVGGVTYTCG